MDLATGLFVAQMALMGIPLAGLYPSQRVAPVPETGDCYIWKATPRVIKHGQVVLPKGRPARRVVVRMKAEDHDAIFSPDCRRAYLVWMEYEGQRRFSIEARRIPNG